jgi:hypothetical protein
LTTLSFLWLFDPLPFIVQGEVLIGNGDLLSKGGCNLLPLVVLLTYLSRRCLLVHMWSYVRYGESLRLPGTRVTVVTHVLSFPVVTPGETHRSESEDTEDHTWRRPIPLLGNHRHPTGVSWRHPRRRVCAVT